MAQELDQIFKTAAKGSTNGLVILLYVQPAARKTEITGFFGEPPRLKLRVEAPPVDGAANEAVEKFFSKLLGARVELLRGEKSRKKDILVMGLDVGLIKLKIEEHMNKKLNKKLNKK